MKAFHCNGQKTSTKLTKGSYHRKESGSFTGADQYFPKSSKFRFFALQTLKKNSKWTSLCLSYDGLKQNTALCTESGVVQIHMNEQEN